MAGATDTKKVNNGFSNICIDFDSCGDLMEKQTQFRADFCAKSRYVQRFHSIFYYLVDVMNLIVILLSVRFIPFQNKLEHGFRAVGDHIPTAPPIPIEIQKGLEQIYEGIKRNAELNAKRAQSDPEFAKLQQERAQADYYGHYVPSK